MANKTVNLNKNGSALAAGKSKVRVRVNADVLEIRPTNRVLGRNLPKGEILVDLREKKQAVRGTFRFTIPADMIGDCQAFKLEKRARGWLAFINSSREALQTTVGQPAVAGASVSDR